MSVMGSATARYKQSTWTTRLRFGHSRDAVARRKGKSFSWATFQVVQDEQGDVVFVDATTEDYHERLRVSALDSKTWNIPTVAGRYLLVRNDRQAICFELPEK